MKLDLHRLCHRCAVTQVLHESEVWRCVQRLPLAILILLPCHANIKRQDWEIGSHIKLSLNMLDSQIIIWRTGSHNCQAWVSAVPSWSLDLIFCIVGCSLWLFRAAFVPTPLDPETFNPCSNLPWWIIVFNLCLPSPQERQSTWFKFLVFECPKGGLCNRGSVLHPHLIP